MAGEGLSRVRSPDLIVLLPPPLSGETGMGPAAPPAPEGWGPRMAAGPRATPSLSEGHAHSVSVLPTREAHLCLVRLQQPQKRGRSRSGSRCAPARLSRPRPGGLDHGLGALSILLGFWCFSRTFHHHYLSQTWLAPALRIRKLKQTLQMRPKVIPTRRRPVWKEAGRVTSL